MVALRGRLLAVLVATALLVLAAAVAGRSGSEAALYGADERALDRCAARDGPPRRPPRSHDGDLARRPDHDLDRRGRRVQVSDSLPAVTPEYWAEFLAQLTHGSELARVTSYHATLAEVEELCGGRALGCYSRNTMISLAEPGLDGTTPEEVVRHEYGHHIASTATTLPGAQSTGARRTGRPRRPCPGRSRAARRTWATRGGTTR